MKKITYSLLILQLLLNFNAAAAESINLSIPKGSVITEAQRVVVLDFGREYIGERDAGFVASIEGLNNPLLFVQPEEEPEVVERGAQVRPQNANKEEVVYSDASVLDAVIVSFSKQVRGTLRLGAKNYIQLTKGGLIQAGTKFPARLPNAGDQTFTVVVDKIDAAGYTLRIGEATSTRYFKDLTTQAVGITR